MRMFFLFLFYLYNMLYSYEIVDVVGWLATHITLSESRVRGSVEAANKVEL